MEIKDTLIKLRKGKKYSISDLSNKLNIKESKIEKWENGTKTPSYKELLKLSNFYDVKITKFIGENKLVSKIKFHKILCIISIIILVLICAYSVVITTEYNRVEHYEEMDVYSFNGESDNFKFKTGLVVLSRDNKYIKISNFVVKNGLEIKSATINVAFNETVWYVSDYNSEEDGDYKEWFKDLDISEYAKKAGLFVNKDKENSFSKYDTKFPYDFKVEINYCTVKDECTVEILNIDANKLNTKNVGEKLVKDKKKK